MRKHKNLYFLLVTLAVLATLAVATLAGEKIKTYQLVVDSTMQVGGQALEPGNYDVTVAAGENQKAQVTILKKNQTIVRFEATMELLQNPNQEDGHRIILPDGKTRKLQKVWFRGTKYLLEL